MDRAQTSVEYLIILAIVIVIALVVVGVMGGIPTLGAASTTKASEAYWQSADIGITGHYVSASAGSTDTIIVKNNNQFQIRLLNMYIGNNSIVTTAVVMNPGQERTFSNVIVNSDAETLGTTYSYRVNVTYNDTKNNLGPYLFTSAQNLVGTFQ